MTQINEAGQHKVSSRKKAGVRGMIKNDLKIDMTPMVDLGFLLISFFVITTELSKPTAMDLYLQKPGPDTPVAQSDALTVLLDRNNTIYYYSGDWEEAARSNSIMKTNFSGTGLRNVIMEKQQQLDRTRQKAEGRNGLMLLVKPTGGASYKNLVDVLDEITISMVKKYAVMKISAEETGWLQKMNAN